jgi:hypothetical protein
MTTHLTPTQQALLPSDEDVAFYREHGFFISSVILSDEILDEALRGMERFYTGDRDAPFPGPPGIDEPGWLPEHGDVLRKNDYASLQVRELRTLATYPIIGAVAARLSGSSLIRLWHDQLLYKPVESPTYQANVGWHTDRQYWATCTSDEMITAWVPFHDVDEMAGSLTFVDASHRWSSTATGLDFFNQDLNELEWRMKTNGAAVAKIPAALKRGQVSFHHCRIIHGSGPNRGFAPRRSLAIHMQTADNRYQFAQGPNGEIAEHFSDRLCRRADGTPDYTDPDLFPVLWRETNGQ